MKSGTIEAHIKEAGEVMHLVGACGCHISEREWMAAKEFQTYLAKGCQIFAATSLLTDACAMRVLYVMYTRLLEKMPEVNHDVRRLHTDSQTDVN